MAETPAIGLPLRSPKAAHKEILHHSVVSRAEYHGHDLVTALCYKSEHVFGNKSTLQSLLFSVKEVQPQRQHQHPCIR